MTILTHSPAETQAFAETLGRQMKKGTCIAFEGSMGAGKTTFTRGLAKGMGLPDEVSSPTFALVNEYHGEGAVSMYHFDMYRVTSPEALETTGFWDYPLEDAVFVIEWAENIADAIPADAVRITITRIDDDTRSITVEGGNFSC
ncbi:MAG: tRNA (adenosine(37)-N6)-threonylcarbamoyltransferase complex ATPase subunit type 1 TsaE [Oscillospiraceae bacterium]|nr:tRNA (adenosine(37)-N6)-threonylcarbamoyltransferase complex ATPase subunit type 1 TsaE [Oscillospiraceae bacterium]